MKNKYDNPTNNVGQPLTSMEEPMPPVDNFGGGSGGFSSTPSMDFTGEEQESVSYPTIGIIKELNPSKDVEKFENYLRGRVYDADRKKWVEKKINGKVQKPYTLNEKGISFVVGVLQSANQTLRTTYLNEDEIDTIMRHMHEQYIPLLMLNHKEYGINDAVAISGLITQITIQLYAVLKKAYKGGDRNLIRGVIKESLGGSISYEPPIKKSWLPWRR